MVLAPSKELNIFSPSSLPTNGFLKPQMHDDLRNRSHHDLSSVGFIDHSDVMKESSLRTRDRYHSIEGLTGMQSNAQENKAKYQRHNSTDSLNTAPKNEPNNNLKNHLHMSKSLGNLHWKKTPPKVPAKPLKRRLSNLFSFRSHESTNTPPVIKIERSFSDTPVIISPETSRSRTPNLFRKFNRTPPPVLEENENEDDSNLKKTQSRSFLSLHSSSATTTVNRNTNDVKKSNSFSLKTDETPLKIPGIQRSFPSLRSPFMKPKFEHYQTHRSSEDIRKNIYTEMVESIQTNDCKRLKLLLKRRRVDSNNIENNLSLIHEASFKGCVKCTKALIKAGWSVNLSDQLSWKPLHAAVYGGSLEIVKVLLENGACVDEVTLEGLSPLHLAVHKEDLYMVHELFTHGSNPLITSKFSSTPFQLSIDLKKTLIIDYFLLQSCFLVKGSD